MRRQTVIGTDRFSLTTWVPSDIGDLHALHADPQVMRYIGGAPESREQSEQRLGRYLAQQATQGWTKWRVTNPRGVMIGRAGFGLNRGHRELGYTLCREVWGRGIGTELARELVAWHRENPDAGRYRALVAFTEIDHSASRRVLQKAGFVFVDERDHEGTLVAFYECG
ncbi:GNAT family N-acetyltransferase [Cumulibacter soli]|uniref:GNAT family N-acetyltransferase n=1 Tax=Cumulibacter soli TaxID=2546344 RepID=UPI001419D5A7|nr:GNAT family N-acetyltransferase [Cumulibacter soli]